MVFPLQDPAKSVVTFITLRYPIPWKNDKMYAFPNIKSALSYPLPTYCSLKNSTLDPLMNMHCLPYGEINIS